MKKRIASFVLVLVLVLSSLPLSAFVVGAATEYTEPTIEVQSVYSAKGSVVDVNIDLKKNPGIAGATLKVDYDSDLTLIGAKNGEAFSDLTLTIPGSFKNPSKFLWDSLSGEVNADDTILTLKFRISDDAEENANLEVNVSYQPGDIYNENMEEVNFQVVNGCITVINYIPGDVNDDGIKNGKDVTLVRRHIVGGYDQTIIESAADVNADSRINGMDVTLIRRHIVDGTELLPAPVKCNHDMDFTEYKAATCTEDGNRAYWYCSVCEKYFDDADGKTEITYENTVIEELGHEVVIDPAKEPTKTETGLTEGSHCDVCEEVFVKQEIIPVISGYSITYNIATGDSSKYIASHGLDATIPNEKREYFKDEGLAELPTLTLDGFQFIGWFTAPPENPNAVEVTKIPKDSEGNITLYAHWHEYVYDVTYKLYQTPLAPITDEEFLHYTVSKGLMDLPNPELYNYVFLGWYTDEGQEMTNIPVGTTDNITLNAYWTSKRNLTKAVKNLDDPIILEDSKNGRFYFTYEIGSIENVPLSDPIWTIQSVAGLAQQKSESVTTSVSYEQSLEIGKTIANTTVDSATWTLAENWNDVTNVSESWASERGMTVEEANTLTKSTSGTYSFTSSNGGADTTTTNDGTTTIDYDSKNTIKSKGAEFTTTSTDRLKSEMHAEIEAPRFGKAGGSIEAEMTEEDGETKTKNKETNKHTGSDKTTIDTTVKEGTTSWNKSSTSSTTNTASSSQSVTKALSEIVSNTKGYGKSYSAGGENSESFGSSTTDSKSSSTASTFTYSTAETKTTTTTYSTDGKSDGCYRLVIAGTVHVFGVVGYDVSTKSYFAYTFNVLDDKTHEFLDYSPSLSFDDNENGAIPFEVPFFVHDYVKEKTVATSGLQFTTDTINGTAKVIGYDGDSTDVSIPAYFSSSNKAYKVTSISEKAFAGKDIRSISLSNHISEIPAGAFKNCTNLEEISGYYTKIGAEAFSGCTALTNYNITPSMTEIGKDAFKDAFNEDGGIHIKVLNKDYAMEEVEKQNPDGDKTESQLLDEARALTQNVVDATLNSGAQRIIMDISDITEGTVLTLNVPEIESFELRGGLKEYNDLKLNCDAATTTIKEITVHNCTRVPMEISSQTLNLDAVTIEGNGFALLHSATNPTISLTRDSRLISIDKHAVVWNNPNIVSEVIDDTVGTLYINGDVYLYGDITGEDYLTVNNGKYASISLTEFENYIKGVYTVKFDPNGGQVDTEEITVIYGSTFDSLPTPTLDYHTFDGWYTEDGTEITQTSVMKEAKDITLTAHWTQNDASGWVLASEMPDDAEIVNEKWTYDLTTQTTSSSSTAPAGYTQYQDPTWVWGAYGAWSSWTTTKYTASDYRQVETKNIPAVTKTVWHYSRDISATTGGYSTYSLGHYGNCQYITLDYRLGVTGSTNGHTSYGPYVGNYGTYYKNYWWNEKSETVVVSNAYTQYRYRDRSKIYTYYYHMIQAKESATEITPASGISNIQKWVQYREK